MSNINLPAGLHLTDDHNIGDFNNLTYEEQTYLVQQYGSKELQKEWATPTKISSIDFLELSKKYSRKQLDKIEFRFQFNNNKPELIDLYIKKPSLSEYQFLTDLLDTVTDGNYVEFEDKTYEENFYKKYKTIIKELVFVDPEGKNPLPEESLDFFTLPSTIVQIVSKIYLTNLNYQGRENVTKLLKDAEQYPNSSAVQDKVKKK